MGSCCPEAKWQGLAESRVLLPLTEGETEADSSSSLKHL